MRKYARRHHHPRATDRSPVAWGTYAHHVMAIIREKGLVSERWVWKATNVLNADIRDGLACPWCGRRKRRAFYIDLGDTAQTGPCLPAVLDGG